MMGQSILRIHNLNCWSYNLNISKYNYPISYKASRFRYGALRLNNKGLCYEYFSGKKKRPDIIIFINGMIKEQTL